MVGTAVVGWRVVESEAERLSESAAPVCVHLSWHRTCTTVERQVQKSHQVRLQLSVLLSYASCFSPGNSVV
jgi:hypothetical protein